MPTHTACRSLACAHTLALAADLGLLRAASSLRFLQCLPMWTVCMRLISRVGSLAVHRQEARKVALHELGGVLEDVKA